MNKVFFSAVLILGLSSPLASAKFGRKLNTKFDRADINSDNMLTEIEFQGTQNKGMSVAFCRFRFRATDTNNDTFVSREEFIASRGGNTQGKPNRADLFVLADQNDDDVLDISEYGDTLGPRTAAAKVLKSFRKRDKDSSSGLTPREFGIGRGFPFPFG